VRLALVAVSWLCVVACSGDGHGVDSSPPSLSTCKSRCKENANCQYSLCLLNKGSTCSTAHVAALAACDKITASQCTQALLNLYTCGSSASSGGSSCANTCDGCCSGSTCVPLASQTSSKCGDFGDVCKACPSGTTCQQGDCGTGTKNPGELCSSTAQCDAGECALGVTCAKDPSTLQNRCLCKCSTSVGKTSCSSGCCYDIGSVNACVPASVCKPLGASCTASYQCLDTPCNKGASCKSGKCACNL
jgi:hypothetical protein